MLLVPSSVHIFSHTLNTVDVMEAKDKEQRGEAVCNDVQSSKLRVDQRGYLEYVQIYVWANAFKVKA